MYQTPVNADESRQYLNNLQTRRLCELYRYLANKPQYRLQVNPGDGSFMILSGYRGTVVYRNSLSKPLVTHFLDKTLSNVVNI